MSAKDDKWTSEEILTIAIDALAEQEKSEGDIFVSIKAEDFYLLGCAMRDLEEMADLDGGIIMDLGGLGGKEGLN